jgi:lipoprotein signal peptidase
VPQKLNLYSRLAPLVIATAVVVGDRLSKLEIQSAMTSYDSVPVIAGWLRIIHTENPGAAFGMLRKAIPFCAAWCSSESPARAFVRRLGSLERPQHSQ